MRHNVRRARLGTAYRGAALHAFRSYRNGTDFRDRKGRHIGLRRWADLQEHGGRRYRLVESTWAAFEIKVSTIWTGIDMGLYGGGVVFETMVFGGYFNHFLYRSASEREARRTHWQVVAAARMLDARGWRDRPDE